MKNLYLVLVLLSSGVLPLTAQRYTTEKSYISFFSDVPDRLNMKSSFIVKLKDYNIVVPQLLRSNIAEQVEVTIDFIFKPQ